MNPKEPTSFWQNRWVMILAGVIAVGGIALLGSSFSARQQAVNQLRGLSERLQEARVVADSCTGSLQQQEVDFRRFSGRIDSLRREVDTFESMDSEGVPQPVYEEYLETFERYNTEVARWEGLTDTLRLNEASCRSLVERHNLLNDSLRTRMEEAGLLGGSDTVGAGGR